MSQPTQKTLVDFAYHALVPVLATVVFLVCTFAEVAVEPDAVIGFIASLVGLEVGRFGSLQVRKGLAGRKPADT